MSNWLLAALIYTFLGVVVFVPFGLYQYLKILRKTRKLTYSLVGCAGLIALGFVLLVPVLYTEALPKGVLSTLLIAPPPPPPPPPPPHHRKPPKHDTVPSPEIPKEDCQHLVEGELLFEPFQKMSQGTPYLVSARISRAPGANITEGIVGGHFVIENAQVTCRVSMTLDSEESEGFRIEKFPTDRTDDQFLEGNGFSQWDWRVTPLKHGRLHLLLYVTPVLYVDEVGTLLKRYPQPARVITVTPDYLYEFGSFISAHWSAIEWSAGALLIPLLIWLVALLKGWLTARKNRKNHVGFAPQQ
jgi:hypothetical protein